MPVPSVPTARRWRAAVTTPCCACGTSIGPSPDRKYIKGDSIPLYHVVYSPDGSRLAVSGNTTTIRQFEPATGKQFRAIRT